MKITYNTDGTIASRTIYTNATENAVTKITPVPPADGWWNIRVERIGK
jgi:hypothetical protein